MSRLSEPNIKDAVIRRLAGIGYAVFYGPNIGREGPVPERGSYDEALLADRFREGPARLNPNLPADTKDRCRRSESICTAIDMTGEQFDSVY